MSESSIVVAINS